MGSYKKKRPSATLFSLTPKSIWNPDKPLPSLVMSRILAGVNWESAEFTAIPARTFTIHCGSAWLSIETIREDIQSAIGQLIKRGKIVYAIQKLKDVGMLTTELAMPETKGNFGIIATPTIDTNVPVLDPVKEYKIHAYGNVSAFRYGGIANQNEVVEWKQRQPGDVLALMKSVAERGSPEALFRTVGLWRDRRDVREIDAPVYLPWIVLDIDVPGHIPDAHESTLAILSDLEDAGFDFKCLFVSFSGAKGFHIAIATSQIGSPVFRDSDNARQCLVRFIKRITDHKFDAATLSPLQMLRLTGSCHRKTGLYKRTWIATRFREMRLHEILDQSDKFQPWQYPDPTIGEVEEDVQYAFEEAAREQAQYAWDMIKQMNNNKGKKLDYDLPGSGLKEIFKGIEEHQDWGNKSGRDWAAFTLACYCFAHTKQHELVRRTLKIHGEFDDTFESVRETLTEWNLLNTPPLTTKEIGRKTGSAERYLQRREKK